MKVIIGKDEYKRRNNNYNKEKYKRKLIELGKRTKQEELEILREKIKVLRNKGLKNKDIMQMLDIGSSTTFERHISYLKKNGLIK